ncbi:hypothetical protein FRC12_000761 [Ceratobasidium sp. 428]|nr:hypothetical protein FRC12_000761 [Ceratobasidium sp. 428]
MTTSCCVVGQSVFPLREICGYLERVLNVKPEDPCDFEAMVRKEYGSALTTPVPVAASMPRQPVKPREEPAADYQNPYPSSVHAALALALKLDLARVLDVPNTAVRGPSQAYSNPAFLHSFYLLAMSATSANVPDHFPARRLYISRSTTQPSAAPVAFGMPPQTPHALHNIGPARGYVCKMLFAH